MIFHDLLIEIHFNATCSIQRNSFLERGGKDV